MVDTRIGVLLSTSLLLLVLTLVLLGNVDPAVPIVNTITIIAVSVGALMMAVLMVLEIIGYYIDLFIGLD